MALKIVGSSPIIHPIKIPDVVTFGIFIYYNLRLLNPSIVLLQIQLNYQLDWCYNNLVVGTLPECGSNKNGIRRD